MSNCLTCKSKIPEWWMRDYCAVCGGDLPQAPHMAEIQRLRDAFTEIEMVAGFDWATMPEAARARSHEMICEIVNRAHVRDAALKEVSP